jgi:hypothetical protein
VNSASLTYVRTASGRIHKVAIVEDRVLVDERCNLDDAPGTEEVLTQLPEDVDEDAFCGHCFPRAEDQA